jgi:hypothetical protein
MELDELEMIRRAGVNGLAITFCSVVRRRRLPAIAFLLTCAFRRPLLGDAAPIRAGLRVWVV